MGHFDGVGDGALGLFFEAGRTSIPKLQRVVGGIDHRGGMTRASLLADTFRDRTIIRKSELWGMARSARNRAIDGQSWIVIKTAAERDGVFRRRIVCRNRNGRQTQGSFDLHRFAYGRDGRSGGRLCMQGKIRERRETEST